MHFSKRILATLATVALGTTLAAPAQAVDITMFRFFGDCQNEFGNVTDMSKASGECGIIQALTNKFNAENKIGAKVITQTVEWSTYYDLLSATYATNKIPDIAVMHRSVLPNFASRGLLDPIGADLTAAGMDLADLVPAAREGVTVDQKMYALPMDIHALLVHVNMGLMRKAGLLTPAGEPVMPNSPEQLLEQAKKLSDSTGKLYMGMESNSAGAMPTRLFYSWVWQQGDDVVAADGSKAKIDTPAGQKAAGLLQKLYSNGVTNKAHDYAGAEQAFLKGDVALLLNGTWGVSNYTDKAVPGATGLSDYRVTNLPKLFDKEATWSDSHIWTVPANAARSPEQRKAAIAFLKFLNDNNFEWARTGHLPVRQSVLDSAAFKALPHRSEYADTARIANALPAVQNQKAIQDVLIGGLSAIWLTDKAPQAALAEAQSRAEQVMRRGRAKGSK